MQYAKDILTSAVNYAKNEFDAQSRNQQQHSRARPLEGLGPARSGGLSLANPIQSLDVRVQLFNKLLLENPVDIPALRKLAFDGIPDRDNLRAITWKLLLGYLPPDGNAWSEVLSRRRKQYHQYCDELILNPKRLGSDVLGGQEDPLADGASGDHPLAHPLQGQDVTSSDHPLSCSGTSKWNEYFKDSEVMEQVVRDVVRTHPDMHFFTGDSHESEQHREELKRALFMYAKLNPGLRYIQGMNELIAPLYYLFKNDPDPESARYAEADAFWCFLELISDCRDHFCQQLDNAQTGIRATIRRLMQVLQHQDRKLWHHIEIVNKVDPQYYAFRWITLLLTQEFAFPDALRIWDMLLSDPQGRMDCLLRVCTAMVLTARERLMAGDFTVILKTLQRYPPIDVNVLLQRAASMPSCRDMLGSEAGHPL